MKKTLDAFLGVIVIAAIIVGIPYVGILIHEARCPICQNVDHVRKCETLTYEQKGEFDREHGCPFFWCSHYNGK